MPSSFSQGPLYSLPGTRTLGARSASRLRQADRRGLPLHRLSPFEPVRDQYADWGVVFEDAIAILPSNTSFFNRTPQIVLMPKAQRHSLKITLKQALSRITVGVRGYRDIHLTVLDHSGHCITHCKTFRYRYLENHKAPLEELTVEGRNACSLIIESSAPFTLESLSV